MTSFTIKNLRPVILAGLLALSFLSYGQPFIMTANNLTSVGRSAVAWADFDQDGDLDLFLSGLATNGLPFSSLYENEQGVLITFETDITGFKETSACWGDYDNDGDLDIFVAGNTESGDVTMIYRNEGGVFTATDPGMVAIQGGDACWMDYDNDGDLDSFVTGNWMADIYTNVDGEFIHLDQDFGFFSSSAADWGDYDNDGDLDLLILGDSGGGAVSKIFRNDDGVFVEVEAGLTGLMAGSCDWVDYDNDGDLDVTIAGNDDALEAQFYLFRNDQKDVFSLVNTGIEGFALGDADWGDYDNDGDLDLIYSGKCTGCGVAVSGIYRNDGNDTFYHLTEVFPPLIRASIQWADVENDGDLDFVVSGTTYYGTPETYFYINQAGNNLFEINTCPSTPSGLASEVNGSNVSLGWDPSQDGQTPGSGLSYNLRLGTTSNGEEIVPAMAMSADGFRKVNRLGNTGLSTSWAIVDLEPGTYYWSVQAIDQAFEGSEFAPEQTFTITATGLFEGNDREEFTIFPNPARDVIHVPGGLNSSSIEVSISDLAGRCHLQTVLNADDQIIDISGLSKGVYVVSLLGERLRKTQKLVVE